MEVFIAFHDETTQGIHLLDTCNRWEKCEGAIPCIIQAPEDGFEIKRRVLADNLAKDDIYILADILCIPMPITGYLEGIQERFKGLGMAGLGFGNKPDVYAIVCEGLGFSDCPEGKCRHCDVKRMLNSPYPSGVRVCRKGVVAKWPKQITKTYDQEHAEAVRMAGERAEIWPDVHYLRFEEA